MKESEKSHKNGSVLNLAQAENRDQEDSIRGSDSDIGEPTLTGRTRRWTTVKLPRMEMRRRA